MIKITIGMAMTAVQALSKLMQKEMPAKKAFALTKRAKWLSDEHAIFQQVQNATLQRYGVEDGNGNWKVDPGFSGWGEFVGQMEEVLAEEIVCPFEPFSLTEWEF